MLMDVFVFPKERQILYLSMDVNIITSMIGIGFIPRF